MPVPVTVELGGELARLAGHGGAQELGRRLRGRLGGLCEQIGVDEDLTVEVGEGAAGRALRVRVDDRPLPFPPGMLRRAWRAAMGDEPPPAPPAEQSGAGNGFPDGWLRAYVADLESASETTRVFRFLELAAFAAIHARPSALLASEQVGVAVAGRGERPAALARALRALLDLGVGVDRRQRVREIVEEGLASSRPIGDSIEAAFAELRSSTVHLHAEPDYLDQLLHGAGAEGAELQSLAHPLTVALQTTWGVQVPALDWAPTPGIGQRMLAVSVGDRLSLPVRGLAADEVMVDLSPDWLQGQDLGGRAVFETSSQTLRVALPADSRAVAEAEGATIWTPLEFALLVLFAELRTAIPCLVSVRETLACLARVRHFYPELVDHALRHFTVGDVTRVLRGLVAENIRINDLRLVLERLVEFEPETGASCLEHVRGGFRHRILTRLGAGEVEVLALEPGVEDRLLAAHQNGGDPLGGAEEETIRDSIWSALPRLDGGSGHPAALAVARPQARAAVRELIACELPDTAVVEAADLPQGKAVRTVVASSV